MKKKLYTADAFLTVFNDAVKKQLVKRNLQVLNYENALVVADCKNDRFGLFDSGGNPVPDAGLIRHDYKMAPMPKYKKSSKAKFIDEDVICLFNLVNIHFGHVLVEWLTRLWPVVSDSYKKHKIVFVGIQKKQLPGYVFEILNLLGVGSERVLFINRPTKFRCVTVPEQGGVINLCSSKRMADLYAAITENVCSNNRFPVAERIYLSRTKFGQKKDFGEKQIQNIFEKNGYKVIYPETMSLAQQIYTVSHCKYLAGLCGTAMHMSVFMPRGGTVVTMRRTTSPEDACVGQYLLNKITGLKSIFIDTSVETHKSPHWDPYFPQIVGVTKYLKSFFDDNGFKYIDSETVVGDEDWAAYNRAYVAYKKKKRHIKRMKPIIRVATLLLPYRSWRRRGRTWLEKILH